MTQRVFALILAAAGLSAAPAGYRAGAARLPITPDGPIWMSGYASRTHASTGVIHDLWAKALAIEDERGRRVVLVSTDIIGFPRVMADEIGARVAKEHGLPRERLVLNSSHTHTGPVIRPNLMTMYNLPPGEGEKLSAYARQLTDKIVTVVGAALGNMQPAQVEYGEGEVGFAMNRRQGRSGAVKIGANPQGPMDHSVPVLKVSAGGKVLALLFAYACHNTTLTGEFYELSGDYAGFAQIEAEKTVPGATALFFQLCGADQNPNPRSTLELAQQHGRALGAEAARVAGTRLTPVRGAITASFRLTALPLQPHTREQFEKDLTDKNVYKQRRAREVLQAYDERRELRQVQYPVQAVRFGKSLTLVALGGEIVVDYQLWLKRQFPKERLIVAGYSNDVMCYIPTRRILEEGGYEPVDSMIYYGIPAPFAPEVEDRLHEAILTTLKAAR